jgi:hypothetical protein
MDKLKVLVAVILVVFMCASLSFGWGKCDQDDPAPPVGGLYTGLP